MENGNLNFVEPDNPREKFKREILKVKPQCLEN
jgi:hypothetical protein